MQLLTALQHTEDRAGARAAPVRAVERMTRISLATLLSGSSASAGELQSLLSLLRGSAAVTARVTDRLPTGEHRIDFSSSSVSLRLAVKLNSAHAPGDLLLVTLGELPETRLRSPEVKLSGSAQLIQELLKPVNKQMVIVDRSAAALTVSPQPAAALAKALQQTVRASGLFYESHLLGWLSGSYPLEDLLAEPQTFMRTLPHDTLQNDAAGIMHPQLAPLVRQQLDTYAHQTLTWHGCVWPDQPVQIEIAGEDAEAESAPQIWRIRIDLNLPALGHVQSHICLTGQAIAVGLRAAGASVPVLSAAREQLTGALNAHGLRVNPISVENHV